MRYAVAAFFLTLSVVACGLTDRDQADAVGVSRSGAGGAPSGEQGGHGGKLASGGAASLAGAPFTGGRPALGGAGSPTSGSAPVGGVAGTDSSGAGGLAAAGASAGDANAGAAGQGGAGEGALGPVTVSADGLVFVTYVPATADTVVTVSIDPQCSDYGDTIVLADAVCAVTNVQGSFIGDARVCVAKPKQNDYWMAICQPVEGCGWMRWSDGVQSCCARLFDSIDDQGRTCTTFPALGAIKYSQDVDSDGDFIADYIDNCRVVPNFSQSDSDQDGVGTSCDNCRDTPNSDQADIDQNGAGDACDQAAGGAGGAGG